MKILRKSQPTPGDVHIDRPLTNMSVAFLQEQSSFVAAQVFPVIPSDSQSNKYFTFDRGMFNRDQAEIRAPGTESAGIGYSVSTDNYMADVWALHHDIPDQRRQNADAPLQPDREAVELLLHQMLIRREKDWVSSFFTTGVWTTDVTPGTLWSALNSTPLEDIEAGKVIVGQSTGFEPNTLVLGRHVWKALKNHAEIVDRIKFGQTAPGPAIVNLNAVAQLLEVDRVIVSRAIENTAVEGAANVNAYVAGKHALLCYVPPNPGLMTPAAGYTFAWTGYPGAASNGQRISRFRMEHLKSDRVEAEMAFDHKKVSADLGYFFASVVA